MSFRNPACSCRSTWSTPFLYSLDDNSPRKFTVTLRHASFATLSDLLLLVFSLSSLSIIGQVISPYAISYSAVLSIPLLAHHYLLCTVLLGYHRFPVFFQSFVFFSVCLTSSFISVVSISLISSDSITFSSTGSVGASLTRPSHSVQPIFQV